MIKKLEFKKNGFAGYISETFKPDKSGKITIHVEMPVNPGHMPPVEDVEIQQCIAPEELKWATVSHFVHEAVGERTIEVPSGAVLRLMANEKPNVAAIMVAGKPTTKKAASSEPKEKE